jgi:O-antigen/teichoic acid export membrane protein
MADIESNPVSATVRARRSARLASALGVGDAGRALRDFATYLPTQALPALAGAISLPVLARRLFPTEIGVLAIAQNLMTLGWTVVGGWLAIAIIRELPAHRGRGELGAFESTLRRALALSAVNFGGFLGVMGIAALFGSAISSNYLLIAAGIAGLFFQVIAVSLFAASLRPRAYALVETTARIGGIALGIALVLDGHGVKGYLAGLATVSLVLGLGALWFAWPRVEHGGAHPSELSVWVRYGVPASAAGVMLWGLTFIDRYLLVVLKDAGAAGVYTIGNMIGDRLVMVPMFAFGLASTPLLVHAFERHGRIEVERLMRVYTRVILVVGLPCIAFAWAAGGSLVTMITGYHYVYYGAAGPVAPIVAAGSMMFALASLAATGLIVAKRTRAMIAASGAGLLANVVANLALIPPFGVKGAAIATPIGMGVYLGVVYALSRPHATWHFPFGTLARASAAAAVGYLVAVTAVPDDLYRGWKVGLYALLGLVSYVATLGVLGEQRNARA